MAEQYDFTRGMQGPVISTSLFGDAALAGIKAGQNLPTTATAIIEGGIKGYQTGQEIRQKSLQIEQAEQMNEIRALQLDTAQKTKELADDTLVAKLENENSKVTAELNSRKRKQEFEQAYSQADPATQAQMVLGGQYQDVFNQDPKTFQAALQGVYINPNNGLDPTTRNSVGTILKKSTAADPWQKFAIQRQQNFDKVQQSLMNDPTVAAVSNQLGILPTDVPYQTKIVESGKYQKNTAGTALLKSNNGQFIPLPYDRQDQPLGKYDIITPDGTIIFPDAPKEVNQLFNGYKYEANFQRGGFAKTAADKVPSAKQQSVQPQQAQVQPKVATPEDRVKEVLKLSDPVFSTVKPAVVALNEKVMSLAMSPEGAITPLAQLDLNRTVNSTARAITDAEFDTNPTIQAQNSEAYVEAYNTQKMKDLAVSLGRTTGMRIPKETLQAFSVVTPKDLYFVKRQQALEAQLAAYTTKTIAEITAARNSKQRAVQATKATSTYLTAIAGGATP
jgi:hypothetical protein